MSEQHSSPIKTPKQLITVVVLSFVVPVAVIILLATYVTGAKREGAGSSAMTPEAIAERLRPVGTVVLAAAGGGAGGALKSGEAVYNLACTACHGAGVAGAPKTGDVAAWKPRLAQGFDTLVKHAVEGFKTMPAKGGNASLDPVEVARAVAFMGNQSGAKFTEPAAPAAGADAAKAEGRTGEQVVKAACGTCHLDGTNNAPKIGDRAAWAKRVSQGVDSLVASTIKGHGVMPARGGLADLTDAEIRTAVLYMFNQGSAAAK